MKRIDVLISIIILIAIGYFLYSNHNIQKESLKVQNHVDSVYREFRLEQLKQMQDLQNLIERYRYKDEFHVAPKDVKDVLI